MLHFVMRGLFLNKMLQKL